MPGTSKSQGNSHVIFHVGENGYHEDATARDIAETGSPGRRRLFHPPPMGYN
jgi:hypothetical protein